MFPKNKRSLGRENYTARIQLQTTVVPGGMHSAVRRGLKTQVALPATTVHTPEQTNTYQVSATWSTKCAGQPSRAKCETQIWSRVRLAYVFASAALACPTTCSCSRILGAAQALGAFFSELAGQSVCVHETVQVHPSTRRHTLLQGTEEGISALIIRKLIKEAQTVKYRLNC